MEARGPAALRARQPPPPPPRVRAASAGESVAPLLLPSAVPLCVSPPNQPPTRPTVPPRVPPRGDGGASLGARAGPFSPVAADPGGKTYPTGHTVSAPPLTASAPASQSCSLEGGESQAVTATTAATTTTSTPSGRTPVPVPPRPVMISRVAPISRSSPMLPSSRPPLQPPHTPVGNTPPVIIAPLESHQMQPLPHPHHHQQQQQVPPKAAPPPVPGRGRAPVPPRPSALLRSGPAAAAAAAAPWKQQQEEAHDDDEEEREEGAAEEESSQLLPASKQAPEYEGLQAATLHAAGRSADRPLLLLLAEEEERPGIASLAGHSSAVERSAIHQQRPVALVSSRSAAPGVGRTVLGNRPPDVGPTSGLRRMAPPVPPASTKPPLKPRPIHRRSRSFDPATLRLTLVRPFDPLPYIQQASTMEDQPRAVVALRRSGAGQSDSEDSDGDDSGFAPSGGGGLGMVSMCLGVHPSVRLRAKTGGASSTLKPVRDLRSSDKAEKKSSKEKKEKERKGAFWKKHMGGKKDGSAKGTPALSAQQELTPEQCRTNTDAYRRWFEVLERDDLLMATVLSGVIKRSERDQATTAYVHHFSRRGLLLPFIARLIRAEVDATVEPGTLLRSNNMLSALLSKHLQLVGRSYLRRVLHPIVAQVCETATDTNFEVNPTRLEDAGDVEVDTAQNVANILFVAGQVLHALRTSIHYCPMPIREICQELAHTVSTKYPEAITSIVGGYFFLRFLCPALLAPEGFGLVDENCLTPPAKRALVLVSKVLQQLANGLSFGMKEAFMVPFNPFLAENEAPVRDYLRRLSTIGSDEMQRGDEDPLVDSEENTRHCLGTLAFENKDAITQALTSGEDSALALLADEWRHIAANLLGPPLLTA